MSIQHRNLKPGTVLVARYKKQDHHCTVVKGDGGKVVYRLKGGRTFKSPSAAGSAVMGGVACNGWRFWTLEADQRTTKTARRMRKVAGKSRGGAKPKAARRGAPKARGRVKPKATSRAKPGNPWRNGDQPSGEGTARRGPEAPEAPGNGTH